MIADVFNLDSFQPFILVLQRAPEIFINELVFYHIILGSPIVEGGRGG